MNKMVKSAWFRYLLVSVTIFILLVLADLLPGSQRLISWQYQSFVSQLHRALNQMDKQASDWMTSDSSTVQIPETNPADIDFALAGYLICHDSVIRWNNHQFLLPDHLHRYDFNQYYTVKTANGWICFIKTKKAEDILLSVLKIKTEYLIGNDYLKSTFEHGFSLPPSIGITMEKTGYPVHSPQGAYLFSLDFSKADLNGNPFTLLGNPWKTILLSITYILFFLAHFFLYLGLLALFRVSGPQPGFSGFRLLTVALILFVTRFALSFFRFPSLVYQTELFRPIWYSYSVFLPSTGDFILILLIIMGLTYHLYQKNSLLQFKRKQKSIKFLLYLMGLAGLYGLFYMTSDLISNLILNSSIPLNFNNIAEFSSLSAVGICIILLLIIILWLSASALMKRILEVSDHYNHLALAISVYSLLLAVAGYIMGSVSQLLVLYVLSPLAFALLFRIAFYGKKGGFVLQQWIWLILFFAGYVTWIINMANLEKTSDKLDLLALRLTAGHNPMTEQRFEEVSRKIKEDPEINRMVNDTSLQNNADTLTTLLSNRFFQGYWNRYHLQVTFCNKGMKLLIQPQAYEEDCGAWFENLVTTYGIPTQVNDLFYIDLGYDLEYYLGIITFPAGNNRSETEKRLFIELTMDGKETEPGYPSLLLETEHDDIPGLRDFSYAIYRQNSLLHSVGNLLYPLEFPFPAEKPKPGSIFYKDQEVHHYYRINDDTELLIGYRSNPILALLTPFSYLFILFAIMVAVGSAGWFLRKGSARDVVSLRLRVQLLLSCLILVTMIVIGIILTTYIIRINHLKNLEYLREKGFSVKTEIQHKFGTETTALLLKQRDPESFLIKLANVFFTDINLFDEQGRLLASSRMKIFREGLVSERMNSLVFLSIGKEKRPMTVLEETIGNLTFLSAYLPLYNDKGKLLCYINLPYFSKQDRLKNEITDFLVTFTNLYIFLILAGVLVSVLLSNYITAPFVMLSGKMAALKLGHRNEKLHWKNRDEVGELVDIYNRMLEELEQSARLMAEAEREGAWKSMARQVAHEIKNPLTPMKLSAQYLQKAAQEGASDLEERINRFTRTLVEQIDALAAIASDFSNFAKMPEPEPQWINLAELTSTIVKGYPDTEEIEYKIIFKGSDYEIFADRSRMTRILTNLINNAAQSMIPGRKGEVCVALDCLEKTIQLTVSDNGEGIPPERADRIFLPDFTTKSSGMGLGLAIVKGIVEEMNGEIVFIANDRGGTTFTVTLPRNYKAL
jgi:signal transduction histidine kinase